MRYGIAATLILFGAATAAEAQARRRAGAKKPLRDKVTVVSGDVLEGTVSKDTWREVVISVGTSRKKTIPAEQVVSVEYGNAPPAFRGAMAALKQEKWSEAYSALASAEEFSVSKVRGIIKPGPWFKSYLPYYRGVCHMNLRRTQKALAEFSKVRKNFSESRFTGEVYGNMLTLYGRMGDPAALAAFEKELNKAPPALRKKLKDQASRQRADLLFSKQQYDQAKKLFEQIARSPDPGLAAEGAEGVIKCLYAKKDMKGVEGYCRKVLGTSRNTSLLLIASNALADAKYDQKKYSEARDAYIKSVVLYNPGRRSGTGIERQHERALWRLARCYEELIELARTDRHKDAVRRMASSAFRELSIEYPSGRHREDAAARAERHKVSGSKKKK